MSASLAIRVPHYIFQIVSYTTHLFGPLNGIRPQECYKIAWLSGVKITCDIASPSCNGPGSVPCWSISCRPFVPAIYISYYQIKSLRDSLTELFIDGFDDMSSLRLWASQFIFRLFLYKRMLQTGWTYLRIPSYKVLLSFSCRCRRNRISLTMIYRCIFCWESNWNFKSCSQQSEKHSVNFSSSIIHFNSLWSIRTKKQLLYI